MTSGSGNNLLDILVKVGFSKEIGLNPVSIQPESGFPHHESELFTTAFEPEILAAISSDAAVFPDIEHSRDENYPPINQALATEIKGRRLKGIIHNENATVKTTEAETAKNHDKKSKPRSFIRKLTTKDKESKYVPVHDFNSNLNYNKKKSYYSAGPRVQELINSFDYAGSTRHGLHSKGSGQEYPDLTVVTSNGSLPLPKSPSLVRNVSVRKSCHSLDFAGKTYSDGKDKRMKIDDLPLSSDALNSLTSMCFPDGAYCYSSDQPSKTHFLVLTDINGTKSYAMCLTYYIPCVAKPDPNDSNRWLFKTCNGKSTIWNGNINQSTRPVKFEIESEEEIQCHLPNCVVLISKYPYFKLMKDCSSRLLKKLKEDGQEERYLLKECALLLSKLPVPPPGNLTLEFTYNTVVFTIHPPISHDRPVIDFSLELLFQHFSVDKVLLLINCLLLQQRLVVIGSHYSVITIICESILHMMYPFQWQFTYVPVLSWTILELIEAPGTFVMGCHSRYRDMVEQVQDIVLVNVDEGDIHFIGEVNVPKIPLSYADGFVNACQRIYDKHNTRNMSLERPTLFSYEEQQQEHYQHQHHFNSAILTASLELMVYLFKDISSYIKPESSIFHKEKFISSLDEEDKPFYVQVTKTELFNAFLKERMAQKKDHWFAMEEKLRTLHRSTVTNSSVDLLDTRRGNRRESMPRSKSVPLGDLQSIQSGCELNKIINEELKTQCIRLPEFYYYRHQEFNDDCLKRVSSHFIECESSAARAPLYYITGMLEFSQGRKIEALEQFHRLESCDSRLLPLKLMESILSGLTESEKHELNKKSIFLKQTVRRRKKLSESEEGSYGRRRRCVIMHFNKIPKTEMDLRTFTDTVQYLEIAVDQETIARLFNSLLLVDAGLELRVLPEIFEAFYKNWKDGEMKCQEINGIISHKLESGECVLKISETIKCPTFGSGRIGLTQKRLFFLTGAKGYREVAKLRDIQWLDKTEHRSLFSNLQALKLQLVNQDKNKPFIAVLKEDRDLWFNVIKEMWSGKVLSEEVKDPLLIQLTAQNVLIIDAYMQCLSEMSTLYHFSDWAEKIQSLCYYSNRKEENVYQLSDDTKAALQHRIDPNMFENERCAVQCMVYTPGNRSEGGDYDSDPKLWCALKNGKIRIFDASTWIMDMFDIRTDSIPSCMLAVGNNQIWVACFNSKILIIDTSKKSYNQTLKAHTDGVAGIAINDDNSTVYSCSLNNEIIAWDIKTYQPTILRQDSDRNCHFRSIVYHKDCLFCGTKEEIQIYGLNGEILHRIVHNASATAKEAPLKNSNYVSFEEYTYDNTKRPLQLDCFVITPSSKLWIGCGHVGKILIYDINSYRFINEVPVQTTGISRMSLIRNKIWVGTKDGHIFIYDTETCVLNKELSGHRARIRSMCSALDRYVVTGTESSEGKIMIWRTSHVI